MKRARRQAKGSTAPPSDHDHAGSGLGVLPVSLIREHVFAFVAAPSLLSAEAVDIQVQRASLVPLRGVSRQWKAIADSLWEQTQNIAHTLLLTTGDEDEYAQRNQEAVRNVQLLEIVMGEVTTATTGPYVCTAYTTLDTNAIDSAMWTSRLSKFQHIIRLDLSRVPFAMVGNLLAAAATACPNIQALILPFGPSLEGRDEDGYGTVETEQLVEALQKWYQCNGGLRLLHVPFWPTHRHAQVLEAIVRYCPRLWYLRGWHADSKTHEVTALCTADPILWAEFCAVCTELREFNWRLASMWGSSIDAFCKQTRPCLEEMVIEEVRGRSNIDYALQLVQSLVRATSRLRRFRLQLHDRMFFLIAENHVAYADLTTTIADSFVADVIAQCPRLEQFFYRMRSSDRELTVTHHTISKLLAVPSMDDICLTRVVFSKTSLISIVQSGKHRRRLTVHLTAADAAHTPILMLLDYLGRDADATKGLRLQLVVAREDMVRSTYPRGILVKDLITENDLQDRLTALHEILPLSTQFDLSLKVCTFGVGTKRHAICEMTLRINEAPEEPMECRVECHIAHTDVQRYRRKAGRLA